MVADAYSWELTSCKIDLNGYRVYFDALFIPPTSLWELSLDPLRFASFSSFIIVLDDLAPLVCPLFSSSVEVLGFGIKTKGSY